MHSRRKTHHDQAIRLTALGSALPPSLIVMLAGACILSACNKLPQVTASGPSTKSQANCSDLLQTGESAFKRGDVQMAHNCFGQALKEAEKLAPDAKDKYVALSLNDLALTTALERGKNAADKKNLPQAIGYQKRSLQIEEKLYGAESENAAYDLNNLGAWYDANAQYSEGEKALARAASIRFRLLGPKSLLLAVTLGNLGDNYISQKRYDQAVGVLTRSSAIYAANFRLSDQARALDNLANVYQDKGNDEDAEDCLKQVLVLREKAFGKDHLMVAETLNNIAVCLLKQGKNSDAEPYFQRSLTIVQKHGDNEIIASVAAGYSKCLDNLGKKADAEKMRKALLLPTKSKTEEKTIKIHP